MILVIDNHDSFVFNIARYLTVAGAVVRVERTDAIDVAGVVALAPKAIVLSPGPGRPADAGVTMPILRELSGRLPILGICLGHQAIGEVFGGRTVRARHPMHGQATRLDHCGERLFAGLPRGMRVGRYHSLIVEASGADLTVDARSGEGEIMALSHRSHPTYGVQFHPESVLTEAGDRVLANFLSLVERFGTAPFGAAQPQHYAVA